MSLFLPKSTLSVRLIFVARGNRRETDDAGHEVVKQPDTPLDSKCNHLVTAPTEMMDDRDTRGLSDGLANQHCWFVNQ
jgi:hypothetical protein